MRLIHTADWHVGVETYGTIDPKTGLHTRLLDFLAAIDQIIAYAIEKNADAFLFAGDAFKVRDPNPTHLREFSKKIRRIAEAGIPVFLCIGNHDTPLAWGRATSLDIYDTLSIPNVRVSAIPEIITLPTKAGKLQILSLPWLTQDGLTTIGDKLPHLITQLDRSLPTVTVAHADVAGAVYSSEQQVAITRSSQVLPLSLLTHDTVDYVALGHIHKHQVLAESPPVVYSGSVERIDFGEENEEKGFVEIILASGKKRGVSWAFIPTKTRPFHTIAHTVDKNTDLLPAINTKIKNASVKDAIVRIILTIDPDFTGALDTAAIRKACMGAFHLAGISRMMQEKRRQRLQTNQSPAALSPFDALKEYLKAKGVGGEKKKQLLSAAETLIDS